VKYTSNEVQVAKQNRTRDWDFGLRLRLYFGQSAKIKQNQTLRLFAHPDCRGGWNALTNALTNA